MDENKSKDVPLQSDKDEEVQNVRETSEDPSEKLTPDHPRFKQVLEERNKARDEIEELKTEMDELRQSIEKRQDETGNFELTEEEQGAWNRIERKMKAEGYVRKSDLEEERKVQTRAQTLKSLREKYDGSDDYPVFSDEVITHAKRNGFGDNYEAAYKDLHFDTLVELEAKRRDEGYRPPSSEVPTSSRRVVAEGLTPEQIENMSDEEYEKVRSKLHTGMKDRLRSSPMSIGELRERSRA